MKTETHSNTHQITGYPERHPYRKLLVMIVVSFAAMYLLMYAMVDAWKNVIPNVNQFYMAGLMAGAMVVIELLVMFSMYPNRKLNVALIALAVLATFGFYCGIRQQTFVSDEQFLKSMIPHHAAAILMVEKTPLQDPEIKALGNSIISAQQQEIDFMKRKLDELKSN